MEFEGSWWQYTDMYVRYVDANNWVRLQNTHNSINQARFQMQVMPEATPTFTWSNSDHADATKVGWGANGQPSTSRVLRYFKFTPAP